MEKKKIAVFATGWASDILYQYLTGIRDALAQRSVDLYVFLCHASYGNSENYIKGELNIYNLPDLKEFDAALVFANTIDFPEVLEQINSRCKEAGIPVIYTGKKVDGVYFVGSDNYVGTYALCEHLIEHHGAKDIIFIAGDPENMDSNTRLRAIVDAMHAHGLELPEDKICYSHWQPYVAIQYLFGRIEEKIPLPDAVVCANDTIAMILCGTLRNAGIHVPEDLIITGFDNEFLSQVYDPSISSVDQRFDLIGKKCGELVGNLFDGVSCEMEYALPCDFVPSESCGCTAAKDFNKIRREIGRNKFMDQVSDSNFEMELSQIERDIMQGVTYHDLAKNVKIVHKRANIYETNTFHIALDPLFGKAGHDQSVSLRTEGYADTMDVMVAKEHGQIVDITTFQTKHLVPFINGEDHVPGGYELTCSNELVSYDAKKDENRLFVFLPLHEDENVIGYVIFGDDFKKVKEASQLRKYAERMNLILGKYLRDLRMNALYNRLLQMTETDALTHVKNRTAYLNI